jgi:hypothetical protein
MCAVRSSELSSTKMVHILFRVKKTKTERDVSVVQDRDFKGQVIVQATCRPIRDVFSDLVHSHRFYVFSLKTGYNHC